MDRNVNDGSLDDLYSLVSAKKIAYFCSSLKVEQAGLANVIKMMNTSFIKEKDYTLENFLIEPESRFVKAIGVNGKRLFQSLRDKLSNVTEPAFFAAVDVFGSLIAEKRLEKVFEVFGTLDVTKEQLESIPGFAEETIKKYESGLSNLRYWKSFCEKHLKNIVVFKNVEKLSDKLKDVKVVFTGVRDKDMEQNIKQNGGVVLSSVSKECNLVIAKDPNSSSSKVKKAKDLGIEVISYDEAKGRF